MGENNRILDFGAKLLIILRKAMLGLNYGTKNPFKTPRFSRIFSFPANKWSVKKKQHKTGTKNPLFSLDMQFFKVLLLISLKICILFLINCLV